VDMNPNLLFLCANIVLFSLGCNQWPVLNGQQSDNQL